MSAKFRDDFIEHLRQVGPAPFLFIGAGLSRRYLGTPDWDDLLRQFAEVAGRDLQFYSVSAGGRKPEVATLIASDLHEQWWDESNPAFAESRALYREKIRDKESALKVEVSRFVAAKIEDLSTDSLHQEEMALLRNAVVDGIITTNYDRLLEHLFPDFKPFVGEDELLFSDAQGIAEIYKIHGSCEEPDSIVLTSADYDRFGKRKPYLAAKLLTIFVERPVVFLGYSLGDEDVQEIIRSISVVLTPERVAELQNRMIFVLWDEDAPEKPTIGPGFISGEGGVTIPVQQVRVRDFRDVFAALGELERRFPARLLRHLKEHVYEIVKGQDPEGKRIYVQDLDPEVDLAGVDVVIGIGAIEKFTESYKGKSRKDLLRDLVEAGELNEKRVIEEVLPGIQAKAGTPVYKYLRGAGLLDAGGNLQDPESAPRRVVERLAMGPERFLVPASYRKRAEEAVSVAPTFAELAEQFEPWEVVIYVSALPEDGQDAEALRNFLLSHHDDLFVDGKSNDPTHWAKAVCFYDWMVYGRAPEGKPSKSKKDSPRKRGRRAGLANPLRARG